MPDWMKLKQKSRLPWEILILQISRWHHPYGRKWKATKEPLNEGEKGEWKCWLKTQHFIFIFIFILFYSFFICSEFCHTLEWNNHGFTCVPHPDPPSHLPLHLLPLAFPSAPGPSACLMHPTWAGDLFHPRYYTCFNAVLLKHPTLSFSHRV